MDCVVGAFKANDVVGLSNFQRKFVGVGILRENNILLAHFFV
jgi:hypothetical protein